MFSKKIIRTYHGRRRRGNQRDVSAKVDSNKGQIINLDSSDEFTFPIDPFDKLTTKDVAQHVQLKKVETIHVSFNMDSSVEISQSEIVSGRSSTPLRKSVINSTTNELNYSNIFDPPVPDQTTLYTSFKGFDSSNTSILISKPESLIVRDQSGAISTPISNPKLKNSKNYRKLSLKKQHNVKFQENFIVVSDDNLSQSVTEPIRVSTRKRNSRFTDEKVDKVEPIRKSLRRSSRKSAKIQENLIVSDNNLSLSVAEPKRVSTRKRNSRFTDEKVDKVEPVRKSKVPVPNENCDKLILVSGKWRKSLAAWKRKTQDIGQDDSFKNTKRKSMCCRMSMKIQSNVTEHVLKTLVENLQNSLSEPIVLQETDDGLSNLSGLSLRDESDSGRNILRQRSLIYENQFNEESNNISYKQSLLRKRCTSVIETPTFNQLIDTTACPTAIEIVNQLNPKDIVLRRCRQTAPLKFSEIYSEQNLHNCRKIGEGVYGEVFMNKTASGNTVVLKIIPIEGDIEVNGEPQKKFDEILAEIVIAMELSNLRNGKDFMTNGFVEVINVRCVEGRYPEHLVDLWELYRENHLTENDHPDLFTDEQLFIVLELSNAGQDLEAFTFSNALQSYSAFIQIAITLAVAEAKFQFEHRDLHWGNILLIPTDDKEIIFKLNGKEIKIPTHGVKATVIDYTLSRMVFEGCCFYNDLSNDNELFSATGDYQFDIYRFMKNHLGNKWDRYEPYTNILWLHYTIDKMINGARYRNNKNKKHRSAIQDMMQLRDELLDYKNSCDYIKCLY